VPTDAENDLRRLLDTAAITSVYHRMADAITRQEPDLARELFVPEAVWRISDKGVFQGIDEIVAALAGLFVKWRVIVFLVHSVDVIAHATDPDRAYARTYASEQGQWNDGRERKVSSVFHDELVRTTTGWRWSQRRNDRLYARLDGAVTVEQFPAEMRGWPA
jgi:hypothetical protein